MPLGLKRELQQLRSLLDDGARYRDIAVRFVEYRRGPDDKPVKTGRVSQIYGGRYDVHLAEYVGPPKEVLELPSSPSQYESAISDSPIIELSGGRGGGKTVGGVRRSVRFICERPCEPGRIIGMTYRHAMGIWKKLLMAIPHRWLLPGKEGIKKSDRQLVFVNGVFLQFDTYDDPESLRSFDYSWTHLDEAQKANTDVVDNAWLCLRGFGPPRMWHTLTPKPGIPFERHKAYLKSQDVHCIQFSSVENPWVDLETFEVAARGMSKDRYAIEVDADWDTVAKMEATDRPNFAFRDILDEKKHGVSWPMVAHDRTHRYGAKFNMSTCRYIVGVDPNAAFPNYGVVWKVFSPAKEGEKDRWVAIDVIKLKGHMGQFAESLIEAGYRTGTTLIIIDSSARYSKSPKEPSKRMKTRGFTVIYASPGTARNPLISDSIGDVLAKMDPVKGDPSMLFALNVPSVREILWPALMDAVWSSPGKNLENRRQEIEWKGEKFIQNPHVIDAWRYPISRLSPSAKLPSSTRATWATM